MNCEFDDSGVFRPLDPARTITVVSGMPRSGTSMMMQMLEAAGLRMAIDDERMADPDNPRGYFELEAVKRLPEDASFLEAVVGRVVKIVAPLLPSLPPEYDYRVIFMERDLREVLDSQRAMLDRIGGGDHRVDDETLSRVFERQLRRVENWLASQENFRTSFVSHRLAMTSPVGFAAGVVAFLEETGAFPPSADSVTASEQMAAIVDPALHRHRGGDARST